MPAEIYLANAPVSWGIMEVKGWSPPIPYGQVMDEIAAAGYRATELGPYGYYPTGQRQLHEELAKRGLVLTSAFVPLKLKDRAETKAVLDEVRVIGKLLADCGAKHLVLADHLWSERAACAGWAKEARIALSAAEWKTVAASVHAAAQVAADFGLRCVFHHHVGTYIETPEEVAILMNETDAVDLGLCLDTGHYLYGGGDPVEAVQTFQTRIEYLHFKDVNPSVLDAARRERFGFLDGIRRGVFCPLGEGGVDFPALKRELDAINYRGWGVVEQDTDAGSTTACPATAAAASREFLERLGFRQKEVICA